MRPNRPRERPIPRPPEGTDPELARWIQAALRAVAVDEQDFALGALVYNDANITVTSGATASLTFNAYRWDSGGFRDTSNTDRLIAPKSGLYIVGASVRWAANATGQRAVGLQLTRTSGAVDIAWETDDATAALGCDQVVVKGVYMEVDEYVVVRVFQNSGTDRTVEFLAERSPEFWIAHVGLIPESAVSI